MKKPLQRALESSVSGGVYTGEEFLGFYSVDASSYRITPMAVVVPESEEDVIRTIRVAGRFKTSVTVRGAGTGLVGSALNDGIILDMRNFDSCRIAGNRATVGPGITKGLLDKNLEGAKKFFPPNPSVGAYCMIGGMLANNSSGSRSLKYGSVVDNVEEVTLVSGRGEKITLPKNKKFSRKIFEIAQKADRERMPDVSKNSSGYRIDKVGSPGDAHKIILGSEGTLGVILSAKIRILDSPKRRILFVIKYDSVIDASENCVQIGKTGPSAIELIDRSILGQIRAGFGKEAGCLLFVEYDSRIGASEKKLEKVVAGRIVQRLTRRQDMLRWWRFRDMSLHHSLRSVRKEDRVPHVIEDAAVPLERLPELFLALDDLNKRHKTRSITYGHAGDGNIHVRLVSEGREKPEIRSIAEEYFEEVIRLGGTITAEHGDGLARSEFVKTQYGARNYRIFKELKKLFDPENVLNPGKIISGKSTIVRNLEGCRPTRQTSG